MITRKEVAKLAGVSQSTVSRVINNSGYVADESRKKVLKAIDKLDYVPNRAARSLRLKKYRQIACVTQSIRNPFYTEIIEGIEETATNHGYTFALYKADQENYSSIKALLEGSNDGVIILSPKEISKVFDLNKVANRLPTVLYKDFEESATISNIRIDLKESMKKAVSYLIEQGHTKIAFLGYRYQSSILNAGGKVKDSRFLGYIEAMEENNLPILPNFFQIIALNEDTLAMGYKKITLLMNKNIDFTAIAASNDLLAIGAMRALTEVRKRVPDDVSVTGIDDIELSGIVNPSLTTVRIPKQKVGNLLMSLLIEQMNSNKKTVSSSLCETDLIIRESVKSFF